MPNKTVFTKAISRLTKKDKKVLASAQAILEDGGRLYGTSLEDTTHLTWTLGFIVDALRRALIEYPDTYQACVLEIGVSKEGTGIRILVPKEID